MIAPSSNFIYVGPLMFLTRLQFMKSFSNLVSVRIACTAVSDIEVAEGPIEINTGYSHPKYKLRVLDRKANASWIIEEVPGVTSTNCIKVHDRAESLNSDYPEKNYQDKGHHSSSERLVFSFSFVP